MRADRLTLRLVALALILILGACGSPAVSSTEPGTKQTSHAKTATPGVSAIQPGKRAVRPIPRTSFILERLVISAIGINALVVPVGVQSDGDLATPTRNPWDDVGWDSLGPHPGERGSAVIDGHLDRPGGYPAIFWQLRDIRIGNDIQVINSSGKTLHFRVSRIAYYTPDQAPLQDIFGNLGGTYLNVTLPSPTRGQASGQRQRGGLSPGRPALQAVGEPLVYPDNVGTCPPCYDSWMGQGVDT